MKTMTTDQAAQTDTSKTPFCEHRMVNGGCIYCGLDTRPCKHYYAKTTCEKCRPSPVQDSADYGA